MRGAANQRDIVGGALFIILGLAWGGMSLRYDLGQATHMGPGYFPLCASIVLAVLGAVTLLRGLRSAEIAPVHATKLVPLIFVIVSAASFGLLIDKVGLIPSALILLALACYDRWRTQPLEALLLCVAYTAMAVLVFIYGIQLPFHLY